MRRMAGYYDLGAANARVNELRPLLVALRDDRDAIATAQQELEQLREPGGNGKQHSELERRQAEIGTIIRRMEAAVTQIDTWGVTLRDIKTGLIDFPALANGRPIWLCWKLGEDDIAWWHELDTGIAGRKSLMELE